MNLRREFLQLKLAYLTWYANRLSTKSDRLHVEEAIEFNEVERKYDAIHVRHSDAIEANYEERKEAARILSRIS